MNVTYYCLEVFIMKDNLGYVHVYCGDGKGKTTTAMGLCTRAAGYGYKVLIYQFMKNNKTSERNVLQQFPNITFVNGLEQEKFSFQMTLSEKLERKTYYEKQFRKITAKAAQEDYDLLFFDELIYTIRAGLFDEQILLDYLKKEKPEHLEVILTVSSQVMNWWNLPIMSPRSVRSNILLIRDFLPARESKNKNIKNQKV